MSFILAHLLKPMFLLLLFGIPSWLSWKLLPPRIARILNSESGLSLAGAFGSKAKLLAVVLWALYGAGLAAMLLVLSRS